MKQSIMTHSACERQILTTFAACLSVKLFFAPTFGIHSAVDASESNHPLNRIV